LNGTLPANQHKNLTHPKGRNYEELRNPIALVL
jgi:hypothetical protein